jgi:hypothetical protein
MRWNEIISEEPTPASHMKQAIAAETSPADSFRDYKGVKIKVMEIDPDHLFITDIAVYSDGEFQSGTGKGSIALRWLIGLADKFRVKLTLCPEPYGPDAKAYKAKERLIAWYEKFGFKKDHEGDMVREPLKIKENRMRWNEIVKEEEFAWTGPVVFGHNIPDWSNEEESEYSAEFKEDNFIAPAQVFLRDGKIVVFFHAEDQYEVTRPEEAEAILTKYQNTTFAGYDDFSARSPIDEASTETYGITGLDSIPSWDDLELADTAPVAEYQKRTRHADMPARVWVYSQKGKFVIVQGDNEFVFKSSEKLAKWLSTNGYLDSVGTTEVNL